MKTDDLPEGADMQIEREETDDGGIKSLTITAHTQQAEIDLAMEYPRIVKLLSRNWGEDEQT